MDFYFDTMKFRFSIIHFKGCAVTMENNLELLEFFHKDKSLLTELQINLLLRKLLILPTSVVC